MGIHFMEINRLCSPRDWRGGGLCEHWGEILQMSRCRGLKLRILVFTCLQPFPSSILKDLSYDHLVLSEKPTLFLLLLTSFQKWCTSFIAPELLMLPMQQGCPFMRLSDQEVPQLLPLVEILKFLIISRSLSRKMFNTSLN